MSRLRFDMQLLSIEVVDGSPPVLRVGGEVDLASAGELRAALTSALAADPNVVVDLADVTFIDVSGVRVILRAAESLNGDGPLVLANASRVTWLLGIAGLQDPLSLVIRERGTQRAR
jgi:stage II sporulation protein AA (anti-sigma F factor antagonist)